MVLLVVTGPNYLSAVVFQVVSLCEMVFKQQQNDKQILHTNFSKIQTLTIPEINLLCFCLFDLKVKVRCWGLRVIMTFSQYKFVCTQKPLDLNNAAVGLCVRVLHLMFAYILYINGIFERPIYIGLFCFRWCKIAVLKFNCCFCVLIIWHETYLILMSSSHL